MKKIKFGNVVLGKLSPESELKPKYVTFEFVENVYGLTKGRLYPLLKDGRVKSIAVVDPGKSRGKRLINLSSLEDFFAALELAEGVTK